MKDGIKTGKNLNVQMQKMWEICSGIFAKSLRLFSYSTVSRFV